MSDNRYIMSSFSLNVIEDPIIAIRLFLKQKYVSDSNNNLFYKRILVGKEYTFVRVKRQEWYDDVNKEIRRQYELMGMKLPSNDIIRKSIAQLCDRKYIHRINNGNDTGFQVVN